MTALLEKKRVRSRVAMAVAKGTLVSQPCEVCGITPTHAHHDDYSKPLDVQWLCVAHHMAHHMALHSPNYKNLQQIKQIESGRRGGLETKKKYGSSHYSKMAKIRWDKVRAKKAAERQSEPVTSSARVAVDSLDQGGR